MRELDINLSQIKASETEMRGVLKALLAPFGAILSQLPSKNRMEAVLATAQMQASLRRLRDTTAGEMSRLFLYDVENRVWLRAPCFEKDILDNPELQKRLLENPSIPHPYTWAFLEVFLRYYTSKAVYDYHGYYMRQIIEDPTLKHAPEPEFIKHTNWFIGFFARSWTKQFLESLFRVCAWEAIEGRFELGSVLDILTGYLATQISFNTNKRLMAGYRHDFPNAPRDGMLSELPGTAASLAAFILAEERPTASITTLAARELEILHPVFRGRNDDGRLEEFMDQQNSTEQIVARFVSRSIAPD